MRQIGRRGVYGDPVLPDFMVFLNYKSLPWFWQGLNHFPLALNMVVLVPALLAVVFGWFAFRSRVTGVYFSIITQALTYALMLAFFRNAMDFSVILGYFPELSAQIFRLRRYNGKSHSHTNQIERVAFYDFHIHQATERYQDLGLREDTYAVVTDRYGDFDGALACMLTDCGFQLPDDPQQQLFGAQPW